MNNLDKATAIVEAIIAIDYSGDLGMFQDECGYKDGCVRDVYFWLEDGHGNGLNVEQCRLAWELY